MALTPMVFFELATPHNVMPVYDPFFIAVKLTKRFVERLQTLEEVCKKHSLSTLAFDGVGHPIEFIGTTLVEPRAEVHVIEDLVLISVWGRPWGQDGQPGKMEHVADTWVINVSDLARIRDAGTAVTLHTWDDWDDPDVDLEPFGVRVLASLEGAGSLPRYQRREWFDPDLLKMLDELGSRGASRTKHPMNQRIG